MGSQVRVLLRPPEKPSNRKVRGLLFPRNVSNHVKRPPWAASACRKSPPAAAFSARSLRNVCAQGRKLPARPAPEGSVCPVGTWAEGPKRPGGGERNEQRVRVAPSAKIERPGKAGRYEFTLEGTEGSVSPVGCCHRRWQSDPKESTETSGGRGQRPPRRLRLRACGSSKPPQMGYLTV